LNSIEFTHYNSLWTLQTLRVTPELHQLVDSLHADHSSTAKVHQVLDHKVRAHKAVLMAHVTVHVRDLVHKAQAALAPSALAVPSRNAQHAR